MFFSHDCRSSSNALKVADFAEVTSFAQAFVEHLYSVVGIEYESFNHAVLDNVHSIALVAFVKQNIATANLEELNHSA